MAYSGARALITAGGRRIGRAITLAFARAGADVVVHYRSSRADAERTRDDAAASGVRAWALAADAADPDEVERLRDGTLERLGGLDILVANAGVFRRTPFARVQPGDWNDMLRGNLETFLLVAMAFAPALAESGRGSIIAMSDVSATAPWRDYAPYCVSKAAVSGLVEGLAAALAPRVRINAIAPGPMLSPSDGDQEAYRREIARTLLQRPGNAEHIAMAATFLATDDYVTGIVLPVDGGRSLQ